jgi:hypothetical protein
MASLNFTVDEALNILWANRLLPPSVTNVKGDGDGLLLTVAGNIDVLLRQESFANGILKLAIESKSWAFKLADSMGKVDAMIDESIRPFPFLRRENKSLFVDLDQALRGRVQGIRVSRFELRDNALRIEF